MGSECTDEGWEQMRDPIEVNYVPDGDDWQVTATGRGQTLREKAPGLIAARDRADQMVEKLAPEEAHRTVVHLLNGDALAFTSAYLSARLARPTEMPGTEPAAATSQPAPQPAPKPSPSPKPSPTPKVPSPAPSSEQAHQASTS